MRLDGNNGNSSALKIGAIVLLLGALVGARLLSGDKPPISGPPPAQPQSAPADDHAGHNHAPGEHGKAPGPAAAPADLQKTDLKVGTGKAAKTGDNVLVHYRGALQDGTVFDESYKRGQPFDFTIGRGVIEGWSIGVVGMKEGGKRRLVIPPALAYGTRGAGGDIPPNATLTFEIEMLKVNSK